MSKYSALYRTLFVSFLLGVLTWTAQAQKNVDFSADRVEYLAGGDVFLGLGNVVIRHENAVLYADKVTFNTKTQVAQAAGDVRLDRDGQTWRGKKLSGNFATGEWDFGTIETEYAPFHIVAPVTRQVAPGHIYLEDVEITTCDPSDKEFYAKARTADFYDENILRAQHVTFHLNGIPVFYLPSYTMDLEREQTNFDMLPGYSSRHGAFLLMAYTVYPSENVNVVTRFDVRSKRGVAGGLGLEWHNAFELDSATGDPLVRRGEFWKGVLEGYFAVDDEPYRSEEQRVRERAAGVDVEEERWRVRLQHQAQLAGDNNYFFADASVLSDEEVVKDFFNEEYRDAPEPENRASLVHNSSEYTLGLEASFELNDAFFGSVNRLPEATLDIPRIQIFDTPLYYEGDHRAGFLERVYSDKSVSNNPSLMNYDALRVHTDHELSYPRKYMGFLNVIPAVGFAGTYYSKTEVRESFTEEVAVTDTNGVFVGFRTNDVTRTVEGGADTRFLPRLEVETSFKAFKVLSEGAIGANGRGLRHVLEPFARYRYVPEPDLLKRDIPQFDIIDGLGEEHTLTLGVRNKLQTKKTPLNDDLNVNTSDDFSIVSLVDVDVSTPLVLNAEGDEDLFRYVDIDGEFLPLDGIKLDLRARYDVMNSDFESITSEGRFTHENDSFLSFIHSYKPDRFSTFQAEYGLWPASQFSVSGYSRYDFEEGLFQEQALLFTYKTECVGYGLGGRWISGDFIEATGGEDEDDWQVYAQIWLTAFPGSRLLLGE